MKAPSPINLQDYDYNWLQPV